MRRVLGLSTPIFILCPSGNTARIALPSASVLMYWPVNVTARTLGMIVPPADELNVSCSRAGFVDDDGVAALNTELFRFPPNCPVHLLVPGRVIIVILVPPLASAEKGLLSMMICWICSFGGIRPPVNPSIKKFGRDPAAPDVPARRSR